MQRTDVARGSKSRRAAAMDKAADPSSLQSQARRSFLRSGMALAGATVASASGIAAARAQRLEIPRSALEMGRIIEPEAYGMPSKFEATVKRRRSDVLVNRQNWSDWSMTPLQHHAGHRHPQRAVLRAPSRRRSGHQPGRAPARDPRHGEAAAQVLHERPGALPGGVEVLLPRMLGQRAHRLDQGRINHRAADARPALVRAVDRHSGRNPARRGRHRSGRQVGAVRRRGRLRPCAFDPDREGDGRYARGLRPERRAAAARTGLPPAPAHPGLGRQCFGQVATAHQGVGPALEPAQRDRALHRPDARGQMAAVQLRHGVQVRHHATIGWDEAQRTGHLPDRGLRLVGERDHQGRRCDVRRRQELARGGSRRANFSIAASPASAMSGSGMAGPPRSRAAPSTAPATCSPRWPRLRKRERSLASCSTTMESSPGPSAQAGR